MVDIFSRKKRSEIMRKIRPTGNLTTELRVATLLRVNGINGWRRHAALPGRPDFVFHVKKVVVFVDGCFWHGCPNCYRAPKSNRAFWRERIKTNQARDRRVSHGLRLVGWKVVRIWECRLRKPSIAVARIRHALRAQS